MHTHFGVTALLLANKHKGDAINGGKTADHGRIIQPSAVPMQLHKLVRYVQGNIQKGRPIRMPCDLQPLNGRQACVGVLAQLQTGQTLILKHRAVEVESLKLFETAR